MPAHGPAAKAGSRVANVPGMLGIPWKDQDCAAIAQRALRACGIDVPAEALGRFERNDEQALGVFLAGMGGSWAEVGSSPQAATQLGDVIVTRYGVGLVHLSVLVDEGRRLALTTSERSRSIIVRVDNLVSVWKVIRWNP